MKFIGNQPVTFNHLTFDKSLKYYITYKLDGLRTLMYINNNESYIVNSKNEKTSIILPKKESIMLDGTVLDCELYEKRFYVFDILSYKNISTTGNKFSIRLDLFRKVVNQLNSKKVISKIFYKTEGNMYDTFSILENQRSIFPMKTDGIIFTPDSEYYTQKSLKWKPTDEISIDFKIKKTSDNKIILLTQENKMFNYGAKLKGEIKLNDKMFKSIKDGKVYEFFIKNNTFIIDKIRLDKVKSNHISVIISNVKTILNPPNMKNLLK